MQYNLANKLLIVAMLVSLTCVILLPNVSGYITADKNDLDDLNYNESSYPTLDYSIVNTFCYIKGTATDVEFSGFPNSKFCFMNKIRFWGSWPKPSFGSIYTIGLNGIQKFNDRSFCGFLNNFGFFDGVLGFFGTKEKLSDEPDPHGYTYSFEGFALRVKILVMGV